MLDVRPLNSRAPVRTETPRIRRLSPVEDKEMRRQQLFCNCDEKWQQSHRCKTHLFLIETKEEDELKSPVSEATEEYVEISVHALDGWANPQAMKVRADIKKEQIITLIYLGSTYNFVDNTITK